MLRPRCRPLFPISFFFFFFFLLFLSVSFFLFFLLDYYCSVLYYPHEDDDTRKLFLIPSPSLKDFHAPVHPPARSARHSNSDDETWGGSQRVPSGRTLKSRLRDNSPINYYRTWRTSPSSSSTSSFFYRSHGVVVIMSSRRLSPKWRVHFGSFSCHLRLLPSLLNWEHRIQVALQVLLALLGKLIDPQVPGQVVHTHVATCLFLVSIQSHKQITLSNLHPPVSAIRPFFLITNKTFYGNNNNMIDLASSAGWERCSALLAIALLT